MLKRLFEQNEAVIRPPTTTQFLTFKLGADEYGIDIQHVQELRGYNTVTPVANASAYIKGVINLRGLIVPIVDLRIKFGFGPATYDQFTAVMVIAIGSSVIGVIVDSVANLLSIAPEQIELSTRARKTSKAQVSLTDTSKGVGLIADRPVHLIDTETLYASIDFGSIERLLAGTASAGGTRPATKMNYALGSRYFWVARAGERSQVSALKFRPHWRPVPK